MSRNYYVSGAWNVICDSCGKKIKASEAKQRWDGLIVCPADFEMRQPQDFVKARSDKITVPFTRPRPSDNFIYTQGLWDTIGISDGDTDSDYIYPLSGYFAEDYMIDYIAFKIVTTWKRQFEDAVTDLEETINMAYSIGAILDTVDFSETVSVVRRFVRTFNDSTTITESQANSLLKALSNTINALDTYTHTVKFSRFFNDSVDSPTDSVSIKPNKIIAESVTLTESITYLINIIKTLNDTVTTADSGSITYQNYIDPTYFSEDYIRTTVTF